MGTPKYSREDLRAMATEALAARDAEDPRWFLLVLQLALRTGLDFLQIETLICELAD